MLISIPPKYSVAQVVGFFKGKSAIQIARVHLGKRKNFTISGPGDIFPHRWDGRADDPGVYKGSGKRGSSARSNESVPRVTPPLGGAHFNPL
jgi:hypothetical protein